MKKLVIKNLGSLKEASIDLCKVNVIIGSQSSGKSCVLKTAAHCAWVQKRIELEQSPAWFSKGKAFITGLATFHRLTGYIRKSTFIAWESDFMKFSYDNSTHTFNFEWKDGRFDYLRSKIAYIPSERNLVAAIPNWYEVEFANDNIREFLIEWENARKAYTCGLGVLNLGVSYEYGEATRVDYVKLKGKKRLNIANASSGLQSLIPLYVYIDYLVNRHFESNTESWKQSLAKLHLNDTLRASISESLRGSSDDLERLYAVQSSEGSLDELYAHYTQTHHAELFLEEPENNLFPPTQCQLADWLIEKTKGDQGCTLFAATHSPYFLTSFLEKNLEELSLFLIATDNGGSVVKTASGGDIQEIYDKGVDAFFNIESYT